MDIKDFVFQTLKQIEEAVKEATTPDMEYYLDTYSSKGVHFNLAVTNSSTSESGGKKAGGLQIKIVEAQLGKEKKQTATEESVSRIEFNIRSTDHAKSRRETGVSWAEPR